MRCLSCNCILNNKEVTRRSAATNEFMDLCDHCLGTMDVATYTNPKFEDGNEDDGSNQED